MPTIVVPVPEPFDFHLTVSHQTFYRGVAGADVYEDGTYWRALRRAGEGRVLAVAVRAAPSGVEVTLPTRAAKTDAAFARSAVGRLLGADVDLAGFYAMAERDRVLAQGVAALRGLRPPQTASVFEALVMAVTAQQISSAVARVIRDALVSTYGTPVVAAGRRLYAFPTPQALFDAGHDALRALKLSGRKAEYVRGIAAHALDGTLDEARLRQLGDEEAITELTRVRGIGRWTAQWALLRALGRQDVLPEGDLAIQRVVGAMYFKGRSITEAELAAFAAKRWRPYRGLVTTYLFAQLRQQRLEQERSAAHLVPPVTGAQAR